MAEEWKERIMNIYNPKSKEYLYHVEIYKEALLTYEQYLKREHSYVCTTDPDDDTNYEAIEWYSVGSESFAEKDWHKFIGRVRQNLAGKGPLIETTGDFDKKYFYYFKTDFILKERVLHRVWFYVYHHASIDFDIDKFAKHMTLAKR